MEEIPSMWRTELWHPLSVHFPIAILSLSAFVGLTFLFLRKSRLRIHLDFTFSLLLWIGIVMFWIAYYTGKLAYNVEVRRICDPTVLKDHLYWIVISAYIFSFAAALDILRRLLSGRLRKLLANIAILMTITGAVVQLYAGHLGARVVYQQGAAVYFPSTDCSEFE